MTDLDIALGVVAQAAIDMTRAFAALDNGLEMMIAAQQKRELLLIQCAQTYPHAAAEDIIDAVDRHLTVDRGALQ